jgi:circadian clock protein KaiC
MLDASTAPDPPLDDPLAKASTGVDGFDEVLGGGLPANRLHLVEGSPGTGKTTLALQFLLEGARRGEAVLYVTLAETMDELRVVADSHGWSLDGVAVYELAPTEESLNPEEQYTILHPADVELGQTIAALIREVERLRPARVVVDSLAELRLLARDPLRYHRHILGLKQFFAGRRCTVLLLDDLRNSELGVQSIAHSVVQLEQLALGYGSERRRLHVQKLRGVAYRGGHHDFIIRRGGLAVFPRLVAADHREDFDQTLVPSGVAELDVLLGGGLRFGTSVLLVGPAGAGKSVLTTQYAVAAAQRGERTACYIFDEAIATLLTRSDGLGIPIREPLGSGLVSVQQLAPAELSPGQFDHLVRQAVETGARLIVIDSLNGYLNAMAEAQLVMIQLHELLSYLSARGVLTLMTLAQHGFVGDQVQTPLDISYLADVVMLMRYFEAAGRLRQAISVIKKRDGAHERTIRELRLGPGVSVGPPLREFQGVLTGAPLYLGPERELFNSGND